MGFNSGFKGLKTQYRNTQWAG